jgi:hypothetical protein
MSRYDQRNQQIDRQINIGQVIIQTIGRWWLYLVVLLLLVVIAISLIGYWFPIVRSEEPLTPLFPPFTPIAHTETTPIVITPHNGDVDSELLAAWENTQLAPKINNNAVEVLDHNDTKIILLTHVTDTGNDKIDWRISSKRLALELLAAYTSSLFENPETAKYYFVRGNIQQVYYADNSKTTTIRFVMQLKEE